MRYATLSGGAYWISVLAKDTIGGSFGLSTTGSGMALGQPSGRVQPCGRQ